jgi:hypothetical protein
VLGSLLLSGCQTAIPWRGPTFPDAHAIARRGNQLTFVYFRSWYSVECTDFEESVLKHPDVLAETRDLVCCVLDFDWDRPLADKWRLTGVPAFAIVAPSGAVLARDQTPIQRAALLAAMRGAKATLAAGGALPGPAVE